MQGKPKRKVIQNGCSEFQLVDHLQQRAVCLQRNNKTKESSLRLPRAANWGKVSIWEEIDEVRFVHRILWSDSGKRRI